MILVSVLFKTLCGFALLNREAAVSHLLLPCQNDK